MLTSFSHTERKPSLQRRPLILKVIILFFDISILRRVVISTGYSMHLFGLFLNLFTSKVHLIVRLLLVKLLVKSHILFKNILQLGLSLVKSSIVVVLDLFLSVFCLLHCWNLIFLFRVN